MENSSPLIAVEIEIPESLSADVQAYLDTHPQASFNDFMVMAVSSLLSVNPEVYPSSQAIYLEALYKNSLL